MTSADRSVFTEVGLRERSGGSPEFVPTKIPGDLRRRVPASLAPVEFGSFFVALSKPR
ncbi:MAG: hypothetical protein ACREM3_27705 [Candidatus Rokuibacteriota bacterium]